MTDKTAHTQWLAAAKQLGQDHANNAASWSYDGNSDREERGQVLEMLAAGDPAAWEYLPPAPNLSGEFAGELTPQRLAVQIVGSDLDNIEDESTLIDELCNAYEEGVDETFESACEIELIEFCEEKRE